jgi:hypothetical protein
MDPDIFLFKAVCTVVLLSVVWPLAFLGYLVTLYGIRILACNRTVSLKAAGKRRTDDHGNSTPPAPAATLPSDLSL